MADYAFPEFLHLVTTEDAPITQTILIEPAQHEIECIPLFTEEELAKRWIDAQNLDTPDLRVYKMTPQEAAQCLEQYPEKTATHVAMDVEKNNLKPNWIWTIAETIQRLNSS